MARECEICKKGKLTGHSVSHSNIKTKRVYNANLQNVKINDNGTVRYAKVCCRCLKAGKIVKSK